MVSNIYIFKDSYPINGYKPGERNVTEHSSCLFFFFFNSLLSLMKPGHCLDTDCHPLSE